MKRVCAWCQKDMGEVPPLEDTGTTHGICEDCFRKETAKIIAKKEDK